MKNLKLSMAALALCLATVACNNDKPAANTAAPESTPTTAPATTPAPPSAPANQVGVAATSVAPSAAQTTPGAPNPINASNGKTTTVDFGNLTYDWGTIKEGEKMTHVFSFKNTGNNDFIISDARGSCGCTVPEWPKEPIPKGGKGEIKVVFDSNGKPGQQAKTVTITSNATAGEIKLNIKGNVTPK